MSKNKFFKLGKHNPKNMELGTSTCCGSSTTTIPPCFGDPAMTICNKCFKETEIVWKPMYEEVSKGTYRLIEHDIKNDEDYDAIVKIQPKIIGQALVKGEWRDVELIDERKIEETGSVRVIWRDHRNRRVTSFVSQSNYKKHQN